MSTWYEHVSFLVPLISLKIRCKNCFFQWCDTEHRWQTDYHMNKANTCSFHILGNSLIKLFFDGIYSELLTRAVKAACTRCKFALASQVAGMRADVHACYGKFEWLELEASCYFHYAICMKRLRAHPRDSTVSSQLKSFTRGLNKP
jgi:hypothetical protein